MLCQLFPELQAFYPTDPFSRHKIDALLDFNGTELRPVCKTPMSLMEDINRKHALGLSYELPSLKAKFNDSLAPMLKQLEALNSKLDGKIFLCGDIVTIADFQACAQCLDLVYMGLSYEKYPNVNRWRRQMALNINGFKQVNGEYFKWLGTQPFERLEALYADSFDNDNYEKINTILNSFLPD